VPHGTEAGAVTFSGRRVGVRRARVRTHDHCAEVYPARFAGNTVEFIADMMDKGKILMQTACPVAQNAPVEHTRHRIFVHQCRALIQVAHWLQQGRMTGG
jgi:folate-dependent phosphoribosylglycinamide formyltransferase PurN